MLRATCTVGLVASVAAAYGASDYALFVAWLCWIVLASAIPLLQYPWDNLLSEVGFATCTLLPPLMPLHTAAFSFADGSFFVTLAPS